MEEFDVLIVGAGISGIGGAYHLQTQCPDKTFVVLDNQESFGGTWKTHTYPGIRSDSDLYTFGYRFKPWLGKPIATAQQILDYMGEVIEDNDLDRHIRYQQAISRAKWDSAEQLWTLESQDTTYKGKFLWMCQGYYRHSEGYTPEWDGMTDFEGRIVHPQTWPDDLDYEDQNVVVIGSGATAATLIPAMAGRTKHITMLQRSPTFFSPGRNADDLAELLTPLGIPDEWFHEIMRRKALADQKMVSDLSMSDPDLVKDELIGAVREFLGDDFDIDKHFTPKYRPWRQRIAKVPDGDLFRGIASGDASVVTDHIDRFTPRGILLESGEELEADIIVTATGFNLNVLGDIEFTIDGDPLQFHETVTYRGAMFTGIPNMAWVFGYFRASWTLRADLIADFVCRLLKHMDSVDADVVVPKLRPEDADMELLPWVEPENFNPGYLQRGMHLLPKQGVSEPWQHAQDYWSEREELPAADLEDGTLVFS